MCWILIVTLAATVVGYESQIHKYEEKIEYIREAAIDSVELYNDLCAEARPCQGIEDDEEYCTDKAADARGSASLLIDMHYEGVKCASETILMHIDD